MTTWAFDGAPGSGKSYGMHCLAFNIAEKKKKDGIVTNQPLNLDELQKWALKHKMYHLADIARRKRVKYETKLDKLLGYNNSIVIFDEAGIFANTHDWKELRKDNPNFVIDLCQTRKIGVDLIWSAQSHEMVDKQLKLLTNYYYSCATLGRLYFRNMFDWFGFDAYKRTGKYRKQRLKKESGVLDLDIFKIYDSYIRLENASNRGLSFDQVEMADIADHLHTVSKNAVAAGVRSDGRYNVSTTGFYYQPRDGRPPVVADVDPGLAGRLASYLCQSVPRVSNSKTRITGILMLPEEVLERVGV